MKHGYNNQQVQAVHIQVAKDLKERHLLILNQKEMQPETVALYKVLYYIALNMVQMCFPSMVY